MRGIFHASDGAAIGYRLRGTGPLLVLVHGGLTDHRCFDPVVPLLEGFTTLAYDRRAHGMSRGSPSCSLEREAHDVAEIVAAFKGDGESYVVGYSYGAIAAWYAMAVLGAPVRAAVLYEPPMQDDGMFVAADEVLALVDAAQHDEAVALFATSTFHLSDEVVGVMRDTPMWQISLDVIDTLGPEVDVARRTAVAPPVKPMPPLRLLVAHDGGNPAFHRIAERIADVTPACEILPIPGLPHFALATHPQEFAHAVRTHFERHR